eukprot:1575135-Pyramimonas_sp.AAC.1
MNNILKAGVFTGISAAGALVQKLIATPHELAPFRLCLVLLQPELAPDIQNTPRCMLDPWSSKFLQENDLTTEDAMVRLL